VALTLERGVRAGGWVPWRAVLAERRDRVLFGAVSLAVAVLYSLLLPAAYTQALSLANWRFLRPELAAFSLAFGVVLGWVVSLQAFAMRRAAPGGVGPGAAAAVVLGVLPNMLCCTPVIPTLLALGGVSVAGVYGLSGRLQSFFARQETPFLVASLALLVASALWSGARVARAGAACACGGGGAACGAGEGQVR
jgi:hypothetical protein